MERQREVAQLTHLERTPAGVRWSADGKQIAFTMLMPDNDPILAVKLPERPRGAEWAKPAVIVDRLTWARDGQGPLPLGYSHVFVIDSVLGGTPRQVTSGKYHHDDPEWSRDGKTLYVSGIRKADAEHLRGDSEQTALHTSEIETALAHLEAFRASAAAIGEILARDKSTAPPPAEPEMPAAQGRKRTLSRMIARVLEGRAPDEVFGARSVTQEIQVRWGAKLRRRPDPRSVAATLRRWGAAGRIHQVREGRAYYESLYRKTPPADTPS